MIDCEQSVKIALHVRGTNPCNNSVNSLIEAINVADCCRQMNRCDLAAEILDIASSFSIAEKEPVFSRLLEQRKKVASGDLSGDGRMSDGTPTDLPPLLVRGLNFAAAMFRWVAAGRPVRSQSEIDERLAICQSCPQLVENVCQKCGCACVEENSVLNKLALATEKCPIGKWS